MFETPPIILHITQQIVKKKTLITRVWMGMYILGLLFVLACWFVPTLHPFWSSIGEKMGSLSVLFLFAALTPGIIRRFDLRGIFSQIQLLLMVFRRHLGISMFLFALSHMLFVKTFPALKYDLSFVPNTLYEAVGSIAIVLALPLFLTSNDPLMRILGPYWKKLQSMVYVIALLVTLHIALLGGIKPIGLISALLLILESLSWIYRWNKKTNHL